MSLKLQHVLGIAVFACTVAAYTFFVIMGRRWRRGLETEGQRYWTAPKEERVSDLVEAVWRPKLVATLYTLAYFTNGYARIAFTVWVPFFLFEERGLDTMDVALFVGLIYVSWSWKMFLGLLADACHINFRGKPYRRLPWFLGAGVLYLIGSLIFVLSDPTSMPVWSAFLPTIIVITTAGAIYDISADSYAVDATPPEFHGRVLGTASRLGRSLGGGLASVLPPLLLGVGGYRLVFLSASLTGLFAFLCLFLKEPPMEQERVFSREAIAFTFTERTVIIGCLTMFAYAFSLRSIASSLGGMFAFIVKEIVGVSPELVGRISLVTLLAGIPASLLGGWASDKWGHRKIFIASSLAMAASGLLWVGLREGMVLWFAASATLISFVYTINLASLLALMGDITPFALSSTVFQMYMSFIWIGNIPVSVLFGYLLTVNLPLCLGIMIFFTVVMSVVSRYIQPFEVGKATKT
jgi:MFS family permease